MSNKTLHVEVSGTTVIVVGERDGIRTELGIFPDGLLELQSVFARLGEPDAREQHANSYVLTWRIGPVTMQEPLPAATSFVRADTIAPPMTRSELRAKRRTLANGSGTFRPVQPTKPRGDES